MKRQYQNLSVEDLGASLKIQASLNEKIIIGKCQMDGLIGLFFKIKAKDELLQHLANATKTYFGAHGHGKAHRNNMIRKGIAKELTDMGIEIPHEDVLLSRGIFNGDGTS